MKQIFAEKAPSAIGPYCHAVIAGNMIFCSGQIALVPETMELKGDDIEIQTRQVMKNIETVLAKAGSSITHIIKTTVFLKNMDDFAGMNKIYEEFLKGHKPARSAVEVSKLPKEAIVEIECIASLIDY
ncbi:MAG: RidA family protein [Thermodesulfobacteriota bacterium]|nr:RidA family protein [Thermodesulfobacteriota bacterium]